MGIIRVFDIKSEIEINSLEDYHLTEKNNQVKSIDISDDGKYLISGYRGG